MCSTNKCDLILIWYMVGVVESCSSLIQMSVCVFSDWTDWRRRGTSEPSVSLQPCTGDRSNEKYRQAALLRLWKLLYGRLAKYSDYKTMPHFLTNTLFCFRSTSVSLSHPKRQRKGKVTICSHLNPVLHHKTAHLQVFPLTDNNASGHRLCASSVSLFLLVTIRRAIWIWKRVVLQSIRVSIYSRCWLESKPAEVSERVLKRWTETCHLEVEKDVSTILSGAVYLEVMGPTRAVALKHTHFDVSMDQSKDM